MNHVVAKLIKNSNDDAEKLVKETLKELVKHMNKSDPDFNDFSRRVVEQHFGVKL